MSAALRMERIEEVSPRLMAKYDAMPRRFTAGTGVSRGCLACEVNRSVSHPVKEN